MILNQNTKKYKLVSIKGFTLIELLVVIAIIGILSTLAVIALGNARSKARDSKRMTDLNQIGKALDLYYADQSYYPTIITPGNSLTSPDGTKVYMAKIPSNPTPRTDNGAPDLDYIYSTDISVYNPPNKYELSTSLGTPVNNIPAGRISVAGSGGSSTPPATAAWVCGDALVDYRDNQSYATVKIGTQCWMKQNLNVGTRVDGLNNQADADGGTIEKYCYGNNIPQDYCATDGGLYQWHTAMAFKQICDNHGNTSPCVPNTTHQGICPTGWHIPTFTEFETLAQFVDNNSCSLNCYNGGCTCNTAGSKLKAIYSHSPIGWDGISSDDNNFSASPSGRITNGSFQLYGTYSAIQLASIYYSYPTYSWKVFFSTNDTKAYGYTNERASGFSVRCLKD